MKKYILDTNVLLSDPSILSNKIEDTTLLIPSGVMQELSTTTSYIGSGSLYNSLMQTANTWSIIETEKPINEDWNNEYQSYDHNNIDKSILSLAVTEKDQHNEIPIVINDVKLSTKSKDLGISSLSLDEFYKQTKKNESNPEIEKYAKKIARYTRKHIIISFISGLFLASAIYSFFHFFSFIINAINIWLTIFLIVLAGPLLYLVRSRNRLIYGIFEIIFGYLISLLVFLLDFSITNKSTFEFWVVFIS